MLLIAAATVLSSPSLVFAQRSRSTFVWPLSRTSQPSSPLAATFGPRLSGEENGAYTFHRGIDIPVKHGSPVYAIADGVVRLAGNYDNYRSTVVQIRHYKNARRSCQDGGCFYSNYMHLSGAAVAEGKNVKRGELIGYAGSGPDGEPHLHFEIRNAGVWQQNCVHPLMVLPYINRGGPKIEIKSLKAGEDRNGFLTVTVQCPRGEFDLLRVDVAIFESGRKRAGQSYDMNALNLANSPQENPNAAIHAEDLQGVIARPAPLADQQEYQLELVFHNLPGIDREKSYQVKVQAVDVRGKSTNDSARLNVEEQAAAEGKFGALANRW
jgi:hypothetical protein